MSESPGGAGVAAETSALAAARRSGAAAGLPIPPDVTVHRGEEIALGGDVAALLDGRASVVIIDLDEPGSTRTPELPISFAGVVIGVSRSGWPARGSGRGPQSKRDRLAAVDIVLVADGVAPAGVAPAGGTPPDCWVAVPDLDTELVGLLDAAGRSPTAAVTLMQVLRAGMAASLAHDLLVESFAYSTLQAGREFADWLAARTASGRRGAQVGPSVLLERDGPRLTITLNRPGVRNAYDITIRDGLREAFDLVALDPSIEVVSLMGAGPDFCSGGDLDEFGSGPEPTAAHLVRTDRGPALGLGAVAARVTAQLHGACVGAGIELPALAGRVVAAANTRVRLPEVSMGLIPGAGGTASIPRRIGRHRTAWLGLSGAWLDAPTALGWGLVDDVRE